jgi:1-acyl-sn-glycerol-3-phosphate acyltransferase
MINILCLIDIIINTIFMYINVIIGGILLRLHHVNNKHLYKIFIEKYAKFFLGNIFKTKIIGYEIEKEPCIYLLNHNSSMDFVIPSLFLNSDIRPIGEMANEILVKQYPPVGYLLKNTHSVFVNNNKNTIEETVDFIKSGKSIVIFPSGKRYTETYNPPKFRKGAFEIARKVGCKIQPLIIHNAHKYSPFIQKIYGIPFYKPQYEPLTLEVLESRYSNVNITTLEEGEYYRNLYIDKIKNYSLVTKSIHKYKLILNVIYMLLVPFNFISLLCLSICQRYYNYNKTCYFIFKKYMATFICLYYGNVYLTVLCFLLDTYFKTYFIKMPIVICLLNLMNK